MHKTKKAMIMFLSALMGMGAFAPVPVLAEEEGLLPASGDTDPAIEEKAETESSWRVVITEEEYEKLKDINFGSCRLIAAVDPAYIFDKSVILSEYNGVYLLQFEDAETTQAAYAYLSRYAEFIDVDSAVFVTEGEEEAPAVAVNPEEMSEEENPFTALETLLDEKEQEAAPEQAKERMIALVDTSAGWYQSSEDGEELFVLDPHVVKSVSVLPVKENEEEAETPVKRTEASHADKMVSYIAEEADNAKILSIQALDDNGTGNVSAVYAAIMYAIESEADIINLSISAAATAENAVLKDAVQKAAEKGIMVVASAGNNNKNIKYYTPGNIEEAYTIGAVDNEGRKIASSNYGEQMDYAVAAESTSEAAARFSGILYNQDIKDIDASVNSAKVFSPVKDKEAPVQEPVAEEEEPAESSSFEATEERGVTAIDSWDTQVFAGAKNEDGKWVWTANRNAEDHRFAFRVSYSTSGVDKLHAGEMEIRIPLHILKDRDGNYADNYDISFMKAEEVPEWDITNEMVYTIEDDEIVIFNRIDIPAANEGYFEISYYTTKNVVEYVDMGASDPFHAELSVKGVTDENLTASSEETSVYMNTAVELKSTSKKYPEMYKLWKAQWGEEPNNSSDYWYLRWEIVSEVDKELTQPYTFSIDDVIGEVHAWNSDDEEIPVPADSYHVYGYRFAGTSAYSDVNQMFNERGSGKRYDYVITALRKDFFDQTKRFTIENNIVTTVTPTDGADEPTSATSSRVFKYQKPTFSRPNGHFQVYKFGDGSYRAERQNLLWDLGVKYSTYSRYDLDDLKNGKVDSLNNFDYVVKGIGYPYPWTLENDEEWEDPSKYGVKPVHYSLVDEGVYLHEDGGVENTTVPMTSDDYQIDYINFDVYNDDAAFDEENQVFYGTSVNYKDGEILTFYVKMNSIDTDWISAATYNLKTEEFTFDSAYITGFNNPKISFVNNVVAFKIETDNAHYYTNIRAMANMTLKGSEYVRNTIQDWPSVALRNCAHLRVTQDENELFFREEPDADFARITQRDSFIDKKVVSTTNEVRKKQYRITWKLYGYERYILNEGVPAYVEQTDGTFYDLLPAGLNLDKDSVLVAEAEDPSAKNQKFTYLPSSAYDISTVPNYNDSGRTLLKVYIKEPATNYFLFFDTLIDWDTITDLGRDIYNPMAYETGNDSIQDGRMDDGGDLKEKELMSDLNDKADDGRTFIYGEENFDIVAVTAGNTGLMKQVKAEDETAYSYDSTTTPDGIYTYRLRYANSFFNKSKEMILFDSLENYGTSGMEGSDIVDHEPDWKGILQGIDVSQLRMVGVDPVIYVSETPHLDLNVPENHDIFNESIWTKEADYLADHADLSGVKAIAIDASKNSNGDSFILEPGASISATVFMKAPSAAESDGTRIPETFNDVYLQNIVIDRFENENPFYVHHAYTTVKFVVRADLSLQKVSSEDSTVRVPNIQFRVTGTSDYGTEVDIIKTTDRKGMITFEDLEKGSYILQEYEGTADWLEDHTEYSVVIDEAARVWINGVEYTNDPIVIENDPRVHANLRLLKKEAGTSVDVVFEPDVWDPETMAKYAVAIYGIGQDYDENGDVMGLTFGPATGARYFNSYHSHTPTGTTTQGFAHRCVHNDSWDAIAYWNFVDPYVYEQCIKEGCTHSVNLTLSDPIVNREGLTSRGLWNPTGDGSTALNYELMYGVRHWNCTGPSYGAGGEDSHTTENGWGGSNVRATLNGVDDDDSDGIVTNADVWARVHGVTAENAIISAFPENLRNAIGYKAVKYDSVWNKKNEDNLKTSYDKLWLLSPAEMGDPEALSVNYYSHPLESLKDGVYQRFTENNVSLSQSAQEFFVAHAFNISLRNDSEATRYWTRSVYGSNFSLLVGRDGAINQHHSYAGEGLSPCFALSRNIEGQYSILSEEEKPEWLESAASYQAASSNYFLNGLIPDTKFNLYGMSDYGTEVDEVVTSTDRGVVAFMNIEKGTYHLKEIQENPKFIKDETEHTITIDGNGLISTDLPVENALYYSVANNPRYWDFSIRKVDAEDNNIWLQGATVHLYGTSDFGTEYDITVTSDENGKIEFTELEKGNYLLEETAAPTGVDANGHTGTGGTRNYIADPVTRTVSINERGQVTISGLRKGLTGEFALPNSRALDGKITVIKHWVFIEGEELPTPQITLTSTNPETDPAYVVTFDANGGIFDTQQTTNLVYMISEGKLNIIKAGEIKEPTHPLDYMIFKGWFLDQEGTVAYNPNEPISANKTVYACWLDPRTRYAVSVYDIGKDIDINGNTMGLTFGPAFGADYSNSFKAHVPDGTTSAGNAHRCVHDDTWEDIIYWNEVDPNVYEQCIEEGCTKSVPLNLSDHLKNPEFTVGYTGDGPSVLWGELKREHLVWNPLTEDGNSQYGTNKGAWGASRIRAVLNGADELTMGTNSVYGTRYHFEFSNVEDYTTENALIAAFPEILRNAIGYKAVKYDSVNTQVTEENLKTSYDKLWLLSPNEIAVYPHGDGNAFHHPLEADAPYARFLGSRRIDSWEYNVSYEATQGYIAPMYYSDGYVEPARTARWWHRSTIRYGNYRISYTDESGSMPHDYSVSYLGLTPCFSLSR